MYPMIRAYIKIDGESSCTYHMGIEDNGFIYTHRVRGVFIYVNDYVYEDNIPEGLV